MKQLLPTVILAFLVSCNSAKSEEQPLTARQKMILDAIKRDVPATDHFQVIAWHPLDTSKNFFDTTIKNPLRFHVDFDYKNKYGVVLKKSAFGLITQNDSLINSDIIDRKE